MKIPTSVKKFLRPVYVPIASWYHDTFKAPKRYHHLYDTIKSNHPKTILEIGVWNGKRGVEMLKEALKHQGEVDYYGFDLFEDLGETGYIEELSKMPPTEDKVKTLLQTTKANIHLYKGNTLKTLSEAVGKIPKMDFIFIDGGHSVETIASDWKYVQELMHKDTVVIFDDYWRNRTDAGCKAVVDAIDHNQFNVEILPEIDRFNNPDFGNLEISFAKVTQSNKL